MAIPPVQSNASNPVTSPAADPAAGTNTPASATPPTAPTGADPFSVLRGGGDNNAMGVGSPGQEQSQLQMQQQMQELSRIQTQLTDVMESAQAAESDIAKNIK